MVMGDELQLICICVTLMGDLLLNWLNDEIQLSKRITNFEEDFHNGYLFGQLLAKYSQQLNFHQFIDKDDKASRVKNYELLLDTFSALRVTYDSNVAFKIINKQFGVAKKLLYELKTALDKTNSNAFSKTNRMNKTLEPLKKLQISKQKFDSVNKEHFVKQLNELHPAQKQIIQDKLLSKFGNFHTNSLMKTAHLEQKEKQGKLLMRAKFRDEQIQNYKKSADFRKQWEAQNREKWEVNMTIRQTQVAKDQRFKSRVQLQKSHYQTMSEVNAMSSLDKDIADFQNKHLKNRKSDLDDDEEQPSPSGPEEIKESTKNMEKTQMSPQPRQEMREERRIGAAQAERRRHQRQKRRRKMIVEQQKRYQMIEITRRQRIIISTIEQTSRQQKQIQYEIWRAWENKDIITENKALYEDKIKEKNEVRDINAKFKKEELLKVKRQEHKQEVNEALYANTLLERNNQVRNRKVGYAICQNMVRELLDITEHMYISSQERNKGQINQTELEAALVKFVKGAKTPEEQACLRLKHYVEGSHQWGFPITRPEEEVPTDPKQENALPNEAVNNCYLGNILHTIFEKLYTCNEPCQTQSSSQKLLISLVGLDYARKHFLAENIKEKNKFNVICVDKVIEEKIKDWQNLKDKAVQVSKETQELVESCFTGKPIREEIVIQFIKEEVDRNPHSILIDYPNTYDQAIALCKAIGNVQPHDMLGTNKLAKKIREYERLVKGTSSKIVERRVRQCGIDFVWWIDVTAENSFDRMLGRRWIGNDEVHISDNVEPEELRQGEKAAALVMNNHFKSKNKQKMKEWFQLFGTTFGSEDPVSAKCWEEIDGNCDKKALQWNIQAKVEEMLAVKAKQKEWNEQLEKQNKQKEEKEEELKKKKEQIKAKCVKSSPEDIKEELSSALAQVSLSQDFLEKTSELWNKIQTSTISSLGKAFLSLQQQEQNQRKYIALVKRNFISLLTRQDHKFHLIKDFQNNYNQFISDNQDMLVYDYTKEQLHQRVQDLENDLLDVVDQKKEDAISERNGVMNSGWLEAQFEIISEALYVLVQTQLNKFALSQKLITDFYGKKFMVNTKSFEPLAPELNLQTINALDIFKEGVAARLEKMIDEAFRLFNREEEVSDDKNKKGGKGAPPKKDDKKAGKKGKEEVEENKEPTPEELELKKAINTEKAILRQRLNKIKTLGSNRLKNTFECAQQLYTELEDLFVYTQKVEKKAIFGLSKIFKKSIESQQKIESEVQIKHVEVTQTQKIRNFEKQKPVIQPARQMVSEKHFSLSNIHEVMKLFRQEAEGHKISTKKLIVLLKKLINHYELRKLLPETWKSIKNQQVETFVQLLDHDNKSYVELFKILIFVVMSGYALPSSDQLEQYNLELTNYSSVKQASLQTFVKVKAWFDQPLQQKQNIRSFARNSHVKEVLFSIFKNPTNDSLQIYSFVQALALEEYFQFKQPQEGWTYFDVAFC